MSGQYASFLNVRKQPVLLFPKGSCQQGGKSAVLDPICPLTGQQGSDNFVLLKISEMRSSTQRIPGWLLSIVTVLIVGFVLAQGQVLQFKEKEIVVDTPKVSSDSYVSATRSHDMIYLSGKGPRSANGKYLTGKLGKELNAKQGYAASRSIGVDQLAELKKILGNLSRVKHIVKVSAFVNSTPNFIDQSQVANGFSDLLIAVLGERGRHARTSVGVASLPQNMAVEIEMIVEIEP